MKPVEYVEKVNAYITSYIKFGDAKAGSILAFTGVVFSGVSSQATPAFKAATELPLFWSGVAYAVLILLAVAIVVFSLLTVVNCVAALCPNLSTAEKSLSSFPDISTMTSAEYVAAVSVVNEDQIVRAYALHNHTTAAIATKKFSAIRAAVTYLKGFLVCSVVFVASAFALALVISSGSGS